MNYEEMSAVVYVRSSTDDKGQHPEIQIKDYKEFCDREEIEILEIFKDEGYSGGTPNRQSYTS